MLIRPSENISQNFASRVSEVRNNSKTSCFDTPALAAKHLKEKADLGMFYGEPEEAEWAILIMATAKAVVAAGAIIAGAILAVGGPSTHLPTELSNLGNIDPSCLTIDDLLKTRKHLSM